MSELNFKLTRIDIYESKVSVNGEFFIQSTTNFGQIKKEFEELMMKYAI